MPEVKVEVETEMADGLLYSICSSYDTQMNQIELLCCIDSPLALKVA